MQFVKVITVCSETKEKYSTILGIKTKLYWPSENPRKFQGTEEETLIKFREVKDKILEKVQDWLKEKKSEL